MIAPRWPGTPAWGLFPLLALLLALLLVAPLGAQSAAGGTDSGSDGGADGGSPTSGQPSTTDPDEDEGEGGFVPWVTDATRFTGTMSMVGELYGISGLAPRRPGSSFRIALSPRLSLFGDINMGVDAMLSSEGAQVSQNISRLGLTPEWGWGTAYIGDYSHELSSYTLQGVRIRGAGLDLSPGRLRLTLHGGRTQRVVETTLGEPVFRRNLMVARLGYGDERSAYVDVTLVKAKDDMAAEEMVLIVTDPTIADTMFTPFTPRLDNRPQENLVLGLNGQASLFDRALTVRGQVAGALITRDLTSARASADEAGVSGLLDRLHPVRLSTSGDLAYEVEADLRLPVAGLRGAYEYVGAGYTSLGLPYLINDRRQYSLSGNTRLLSNRIMLQGQYQHQNDNVLDQQSQTTNRDVATLAVTGRPSDRLTTTVSGAWNGIRNDAAVDTFLVDTRSLSMNASASLQQTVRERPASLSLSYGYQDTSDGNVVREVPGISVHSLTSTVSLEMIPGVTLAPSVSAVLKEVTGQESEQNIFLGFSGRARVSDGVQAGASLSNTHGNGRDIFAVRSNLTMPLPMASSLSLVGRITRYSAYGARPAFNERYLTLSLSRSF